MSYLIDGEYVNVRELIAALAAERALADDLAAALLWGTSDVVVNPSGDRALARHRAARTRTGGGVMDDKAPGDASYTSPALADGLATTSNNQDTIRSAW